MQWGKKPKKKQRPDLLDYDTPDTPHIERKTGRSLRRIVYTDVQKRNESNRNAQKRLASEHKALQALLANEYKRESKPDYGSIFAFEDDGLSSKLPQIEVELRRWIQEALAHKMSYKQIRDIVVSEFRLHRDTTERRKP